MAAYVIVNVEVIDPIGYEEYRKLVPASIERHGGRYLVRGGAVEQREGEGGWHRVVVLEFPDLAAARRWYDSDDYKTIRDLRFRNARSNMVFVEGV